MSVVDVYLYGYPGAPNANFCLKLDVSKSLATKKSVFSKARSIDSLVMEGKDHKDWQVWDVVVPVPEKNKGYELLATIGYVQDVARVAEQLGYSAVVAIYPHEIHQSNRLPMSVIDANKVLCSEPAANTTVYVFKATIVKYRRRQGSVPAEPNAPQALQEGEKHSIAGMRKP